jgi:hypothetical protein
LKNIKLLPLILASSLFVACSTEEVKVPLVEQPVEAKVQEPESLPLWQQTKVLADVIATGEGGFNSVNQGRPGDTPGGIQSITGKEFKDMTLWEVMVLQRHQIFAVGKFQFIPRTFKYLVVKSGLPNDTKFTEEVQYKLFATALEHKRPLVGAYIRGEHPHLDVALDELALEWAAVEYRNGRGYYDGLNGNRASVRRDIVAVVLKAVRYPNVAR